VEIHQRLEKIEVLKIDHIMPADYQEKLSHLRFKGILEYSNLIKKDYEIDKYNKKVLKFAKKS